MHAEAAALEEIDRSQIVVFHDGLFRASASPVVALNHAVAIGMHEGTEAGLLRIQAVPAEGGLDGYHLAHAARADMQRRPAAVVESLGLAQAARDDRRATKGITSRAAAPA